MGLTVKGEERQRRLGKTVGDEYRYRPTEERDGPCSQGTLDHVGDVVRVARRARLNATRPTNVREKCQGWRNRAEERRGPRRRNSRYRDVDRLSSINPFLAIEGLPRKNRAGSSF